MRICVIGSGYVGLVTAAVFADLGNEVVCLDSDREKVEALRAGQLPIFEPGLQEVVSHNQADGRISFTWDYEEGVPAAEVVFLAVGTPPGQGGAADLGSLEAAAADVGRHMSEGTLVVVKSTVPVGSGDLVRQTIEREAPEGMQFDVASNPEFLREGSAVADSRWPDRIVIGCSNHDGAMKLVELYAPLERPMLLMDVKSAELVKYASNSFLATRISFINSIADLCEQTGADITHVIKGMGSDSRIGDAFLSPGLGYGGSCLPKDTAALAATSVEAGCRFDLLEAVINVNDQRLPRFIGRMREALDGLTGRTIAVLGLSFKPNTDDLRESKALDLIRSLLAEGAEVRAYDPVATNNARRLLPEADYCENAYEAAEGADALAVATEWDEFRALDLERIRGLLRRPIVFDGRRIYSAERMAELGFRYICVGVADSA
jgi:UDPglucose 6-dehydrogenase